MYTEEQLINDISAISNLEKAFRYLKQKSFPMQLMDLVAQDEFSHDVILPFPDETKFLVLGVT